MFPVGNWIYSVCAELGLEQDIHLRMINIQFSVFSTLKKKDPCLFDQSKNDLPSVPQMRTINVDDKGRHGNKQCFFQGNGRGRREKNLRQNLEEYLCLRERGRGGGFQEIEK